MNIYEPRWSFRKNHSISRKVLIVRLIYESLMVNVVLFVLNKFGWKAIQRKWAQRRLWQSRLRVRCSAIAIFEPSIHFLKQLRSRNLLADAFWNSESGQNGTSQFRSHREKGSLSINRTASALDDWEIKTQSLVYHIAFVDELWANRGNFFQITD